MTQKRNPESLTLDDLPGVDPARFDEWKRLHRRARIAPHFGLFAWATAFITVPVVGGGVGWLLPIVFWFLYMFVYVMPLARAERRLAAELGVPAVLGLPASGISRTMRVIRIVLILFLINAAAGLVMLVVTLMSPQKETPPVSGSIVADTNWSALAEPFVVHLKDAPTDFTGARVRPAFFEVAGVKPWLGRYFLAAEHEVEAPVVVISFYIWQTRYNIDPTVLGRAIEINGREVTIIGVGPATFRTPGETHFWTPAPPVPGVAK